MREEREIDELRQPDEMSETQQRVLGNWEAVSTVLAVSATQKAEPWSWRRGGAHTGRASVCGTRGR